MERTVTLSEQIYQALQRQASRSQTSVEDLIEEWLQERLAAMEPQVSRVEPDSGQEPFTYKEGAGKVQVLRETGTAGQETVTLELPAEVYDDLQQLAAEDQLDLVQELACLVKRALLLEVRNTPSGEAPAPTGSDLFKRLADMAQDLGVDDLAEQHDHYLYGTEKR